MPASRDTSARLIFRFAIFSLLVWQSIFFFRTSILDLGQTHYFLHGPNLIFHEAGHIIFAIFGNDLLTAFGGSLLQCLVPLILAIAFAWKNRDGFAACCMLWWMGQNFVDCAPYINDARSLSLTLIGGHTGREVEGHDWEFILTQLDLLNQDVFIARQVLLVGRLVMLASLAAAGVYWAFSLRRRLGHSS